MPADEKKGCPPSYEDSKPSKYQTSGRADRPPPYTIQCLYGNFAVSGAAHIRELAYNHILPLLEERASYGIVRTTIAMIPSDFAVQLLLSKDPAECGFDITPGLEKRIEVLGSASDDDPLQILALEGRMNQIAFWTRRSAVAELEEVLREELNSSEAHLLHGLQFAEKEAKDAKPRRSFFGNLSSAVRGNQQLGEGGANVVEKTLSAAEQLLVTVKLEELCLRTVNEFGLYDTLNRQCVIIRVNASC